MDYIESNVELNFHRYWPFLFWNLRYVPHYMQGGKSRLQYLSVNVILYIFYLYISRSLADIRRGVSGGAPDLMILGPQIQLRDMLCQHN